MNKVKALLRLISILSILSISIVLPTKTYSTIAKIVLKLFKLHGRISIDKNVKVNKGVPQLAPILLFNHPTGWDHVVLLAHLGPIRFIVFKKYMVGVAYYISKRLGNVFVQDGGSTTSDIINAVDSTKPPIIIAPTGGNSLDNPSSLPKFRSGAFVVSKETGAPVQPVLIIYHPYTRWKDGVTMPQLLWNRLLGPWMEYTLHILPPIYPCSDIELFKRKTKEIMEQKLFEIYKLKYPKYILQFCKTYNSKL